MTSRNRGRTAQVKDDANEERELWRQIQSDARRVDSLVQELNEKTTRIDDLKNIIDTHERRGERCPKKPVLELVQITREAIKLNEKIQGATGDEGEDGEDSIVQKLQIFKALREQSEADQAVSNPRTSSSAPKAGRMNKRGKLDVSVEVDRDSFMADSPGGPSPKVVIHAGASSRFSKTGGTSRAGSVPAAREPSVKAEEMDLDMKVSTPTPSNSTIASASGTTIGTGMAASGTSDKQRTMAVGTEVFFRHSSKPQARGKPSSTAAPPAETDGEGILCSVTSVIGEGKQRRYEIRDVDDSTAENPPWRASVNSLVPIPNPEMNEKLPPLSGGRHVLALYPGTTTFYKAEVVGKQGEGKDGRKVVKLRFEGEEEIEKETEVERRYVLADPALK